MAFTLRQLQFFVAAAEAGSVSGAARALSISQSSVTEAVRALEDDLGVTLFDRQARGLLITHKGSAFLRHARQILADVATARTAFRDEAETATGRLSLGVTSLVAGYVLSDILSRFRRAFPQVDLNVIEDNGDYLQHLLIGGELDVAVLLTSSVKDRMALHVETLLVSPYRLWLPLGHPLAQQEAIALEELAGQPMIQLMVDEIEESTRRLTAALPVKPEVAFRTRSVEAVRSLVATGAGLAILPSLVYRPWSLEGDRIEIRDVSGDLPTVQVGLAWRRGAPLSPPALNYPRPGPDDRSWRGRRRTVDRRLGRLCGTRRNRPNFDWVTKFEESTGCKVNVKTANTSDEMVALMNEGGFDLVTASGDASLRLIAGDRVQPINIDLIPSWSTVDPRLQEARLAHGRRRHYGVPYMWGPNVLMYNTEVFKEPPTSWNVVFRRDDPARRPVEQGPGAGL
jgi:DNA-binding transcriptional LysR family regulator